jgi:hypothetical protein
MSHTILIAVLFSLTSLQAQDQPREWIDADTGHRIVRLSDEPGSGSLYFNQNGYTADGKLIWYDLQTPRGEVFWLASYNVETGERHWYSLQRDEWSIHFNVPRDGSPIFTGDGGDPGQVAKAKDGRWIYLFKPELLPNRGTDDP